MHRCVQGPTGVTDVNTVVCQTCSDVAKFHPRSSQVPTSSPSCQGPTHDQPRGPRCCPRTQ